MGFSFRMNFYLKYSLIVACFLASCSGSEEALPQNILTRDEMIEVVVEIELTQALIKLKLYSKDTLDHEALYAHVYQKFQITEEQFNLNLKHYCENPKKMEELYLDAISLMSKKQVQPQ